MLPIIKDTRADTKKLSSFSMVFKYVEFHIRRTKPSEICNQSIGKVGQVQCSLATMPRVRTQIYNARNPDLSIVTEYIEIMKIIGKKGKSFSSIRNKSRRSTSHFIILEVPNFGT